MRHNGRLLPLPVQPKPDEIFTSWLARVAFANGLLVNQLASVICGRGRQLFFGDADRGVWKQPGLVLADLTGTPATAVDATYLSSYIGFLWPDKPERGALRHVLPISNANRSKTQYGRLFCPQCLAEDTEPFFRRHWRLAFSVVCDWHGCWLYDKCPACSSPIAPHRVGVRSGRSSVALNSVSCAYCHESLLEINVGSPPSRELVAFQRLTLATLERGWISIGGRCIHSTLFFEGLRTLMSFLEDERYSGSLLREMDVDTTASDSIGPNRYGGIERCTLERRVRLFTLAGQLLQDWPAYAMELLVKAKVSSNHLLRFTARSPMLTPFWLWEPVKKHLDRTMYVPTDEEIALAFKYLKEQGKRPLLRELCALLNLSTASNQRLSNFLKKSGE